YSWGSSFPEILASLLLIARTNYFGFLCPCSIAGLCSLISLLAKSGYSKTLGCVKATPRQIQNENNPPAAVPSKKDALSGRP
ncbi:MAG: hypothetical protein IJ240_05925, partial [Clostridia bacterium]|nr:hypothetical protein [Clostridia bacterium]